MLHMVVHIATIWILSGYNIPTYNLNLSQELKPIKFSLASSFFYTENGYHMLMKRNSAHEYKHLTSGVIDDATGLAFLPTYLPGVTAFFAVTPCNFCASFKNMSKLFSKSTGIPEFGVGCVETEVEFCLTDTGRERGSNNDEETLLLEFTMESPEGG